MARPGPSRGQLKVGRYLGGLLALFVLLYATVALSGDGVLKPKLGLDLSGGASVILTPQGLNGKTPSAAQLATAVDIIRQRVNSAGVSESDVTTQGNDIVVSVPNGNRASIANVTKTAQLRFRKVLGCANLTGTQAGDDAMPACTPLPPSQYPASIVEQTKSQTPAPVPSGASGATGASGTTGATGATGATGVVPPRASAAPVPSTSPTVRKRVVPRGLVQAATPAPTPAPSRTAAPVVTKAPVAAPAVRSGDLYTPASYEALNCGDPTAREGGSAQDVVDKPIVACNRDGTEKYYLDVAPVKGQDVKGASVGTDQFGTTIQVNVQFTGSGQNAFTKLTEETAPTLTRVAVVLDGVVYSAPSIRSVINSDAQITGGFTQDEATSLANVLKFGALPLTFKAGETMIISPTLGKDQLKSGLLAGGIGLVAVVLYSLLYYRALGVVTIASLLVSAGLTYAMVCILGDQIGFAMSLAGIAGFIVAIGITADSFVVYFERLKDEIKEGRTPRSAVDRAWVRARRTILSADTVSILAAVILYVVSVGGVRGFAFTLGLSTLLDLVVVFLFTRPLISLLSRYRWFSRSHLTGFHGPDGGEPSLGGPRRSFAPPVPPATPMEA